MGVFSFLKKKKGLLDPEAAPPKRMGMAEGPIHENVEAGFDRRMSIIFPTHSPVNSLAGPPEETKTPPAEDFKPRFSGKFMQRLMESRADVNKIYSEGYFENHYPEADKQLKQFLHEKTMASWAKALSDNEETEHSEEQENPGLTVVININK